MATKQKTVTFRRDEVIGTIVSSIGLFVLLVVALCR